MNFSCIGFTVLIYWEKIDSIERSLLFISRFALLNILISACRPKQWTKNLLVFSAPLFSFSYNSDLWISSFFTFICFCFVSSSVYLINDVLDVESDRKHHRKKKRAIASGLISKKKAIIVDTRTTITATNWIFRIELFICY